MTEPAPPSAHSPAAGGAGRVDLSALVKAYDVRGLVPEQLDDAVAGALGRAFAEVIAVPKGASRVVVGHDMRPSSPALAGAFADGITRAGLDVVFVGLAATDQLYYASATHDAPGAMFTASHNPAAYNGIKLCRAGARPVGQDSGLADVRDRAQALLDTADQAPDANVEHADTEPASAGVRTETDVLPAYAAYLRGLVDLRASRPLRVVVDAANGMAGHTVPAVLGTAAGLPALPIHVIPLYFELDGTFPNHEANPLDPANLRDLQAAVLAHGADLGLAFDGDADRCFVVDERGEPVSASAVTALVADREIARHVAAGGDPGAVRIVHNVITSSAVPELVAARGAVPVRTRVGHSFVKAQMAAVDAVFGGEHSAHYYFRDFWFADTGMLAALHVLAARGETDTPLSALLAGYTPYAASGEVNSTVADPSAATNRALAWARTQGEVQTDTLDGLTVRHLGDDHPGAGSVGVGAPVGLRPGDWWFNVRASNTEPLLRLNVEAADEQTMALVRDAVLTQLRDDGPGPTEAAARRPAFTGHPPVAGLDPWLRGILRCPACRGELADTTGPAGPELLCRAAECGLAYRVEDGIPVLLVDEARRPG